MKKYRLNKAKFKEFLIELFAQIWLAAILGFVFYKWFMGW